MEGLMKPKSLARLTAELIAAEVREIRAYELQEIFRTGLIPADSLTDRIESILSRRLACAEKLAKEK
jgi:hypothetical protein